MNTPRVELTTDDLAGQALFEALLALFRLRSDRFVVQCIGSETGQPVAASFEDLRSDPPQWPVRLEVTSAGTLVARIDGELDPEIGTDFYNDALRETVYVLLSLLRTEARTSVELMRVIPDEPTV